MTLYRTAVHRALQNTPRSIFSLSRNNQSLRAVGSTHVSHLHSQTEFNADPGITAVSSTGYVAPLKKTVRNIKYFSLSSLALSTLISPVFLIIDSEIEPAVRAVMVGIALGTSALSTGVIQWVLKPYVIAGKYLNSVGKDRVQFSRLTWFGRETTTELETQDLTVDKNGRMFSNLKTKDDCFYVHETTQFWRDLTKHSSQVDKSALEKPSKL